MFDRNGSGSNGVGWNGGGRAQNKPNMPDGFRQTRPGQPTAKKYGTASADLMREYGLPWKRHANDSPQLPASRRAAVPGPAFRRAENAGQPLPPASSAARRDADGIVGCRDMQAASKHGFWARTSPHGSGMATTPWQPAPDMVACPVEEEVARNRAGAVFSQSSGQSWVAAYHPQPLKFCKVLPKLANIWDQNYTAPACSYHKHLF